MVDAVAKKHPGKFKVENRPAREHKAELDGHGIASHGVVCMLGDKTLWKKTDHMMTQTELDKGVEIVLEALK